MIASKVSFSQHTKEMLNARPLSQKHKIKLRKQRILEFIRELPHGECQKADLIAAAGWDISVSNQYANGWAFVDRMKKNKVIQMSDGSNPRNSYIKKWEVVADIHVTKPADIPRVEPPKKLPLAGGIGVSTPSVGTPLPILERVVVADEPSGDLLEQAKNFAWNTNSDSLREFVAWLKR